MEQGATSRRPSRRAIAIATPDGLTAVVRRAAGQSVLGLPGRHRQYEILTELGGYTARVTMTRPGLKHLLRKSARIVGRVA